MELTNRFKKLSDVQIRQAFFFLIGWMSEAKEKTEFWSGLDAAFDMADRLDRASRQSRARKGWETRRKAGKVFTPSITPRCPECSCGAGDHYLTCSQSEK